MFLMMVVSLTQPAFGMRMAMLTSVMMRSTNLVKPEAEMPKADCWDSDAFDQYFLAELIFPRSDHGFQSVRFSCASVTATVTQLVVLIRIHCWTLTSMRLSLAIGMLKSLLRTLLLNVCTHRSMPRVDSNYYCRRLLIIGRDRMQ